MQYVEVNLPYDRGTVTARIKAENVAAILESKAKDFHTEYAEGAVVENSLQNPIGSCQLEELVRGKRKIVIISSDHTRPVPSKIIMPILLQHIRKAEPAADITILVATGFHRETTKEELIDKYGEKIVKEEKIVVHKAAIDKDMTEIGILPSGAPCAIHHLAVEADLLMAEGFIESHFFAGFSGGRKSVLPGIASYKTIMENHCAGFIASDTCVTGNLHHNRIHEDMVFAAKKAGLAFIVNVVLDENKKIIASFAGDVEKAHAEGCDFVKKLSAVPAVYGDIAISTNGGYPLDQNLYQAVKGMTAAEAVTHEGGVIIMAAACADGHGGEGFYHDLASAESPQQFLDNVLKRSARETVPDQWTTQILARILSHRHVILVSDKIDPEIVTGMHMELAKNMDEALARAYALKGDAARVVIIPDGLGIIVEKN